jgi:hypothetical protein
LTAGKDVSIEAEDIVGIHYQATTGADIAKWEDSMCCSEKQSVWTSNSVIIIHTYVV